MSSVIANLLDLIDADPGFAGLRSTLDIMAEADDDSMAAGRRFTQAILRDGALTAQLMRQANGSGRAGRSVSTVDKAIAILGMDKVRATAARLPAVDTPGTVPSTAQAELMQAEMVAAAFCGMFAAGLTRTNAVRLNPQESQVCGLLQNLGRVLGSYYLYDDIVRSQALQADQNLSEDEAFTHTVGTGFDQIGVAVSRHWKFPDVIQKSLEAHGENVPPRPVASTLEWHQYCAGFARCVTDALFRLPEHQSRAAMAADMYQYRSLLRLKDAEVSELVEGIIEDLDRSLAGDGTGNSVARACDRLRKASERVTDWLSPQDSLTKNSGGDSRKTRVEVIYQILRSIHDKFGFDMTLLCVPNGPAELVAISGIGRNANQIISRFRCGGSKQDLFRSVAAKAMGLYVGDVRGGPYAKYIPAWYAELVGARSLYIMSLMQDGEPLGIVYGDYTAQKDVAPEGLDDEKVRLWRSELVNALRPPGEKRI